MDWISQNSYILQPELAKTLISILSCTERIEAVVLFWKGASEDWPMTLEEFQKNQSEFLSKTYQQVDNAVLEMAVEVPMDDAVIAVRRRLVAAGRTPPDA